MPRNKSEKPEPAIEYANGYKCWYRDGVFIREERA